MRAATKDERQKEENMFKDVQTKGEKKKGKQKREGGSAWYYEDEDALHLDIDMIKKFSKLKITAPLNKPDLVKTAKDLEEIK